MTPITAVPVNQFTKKLYKFLNDGHTFKFRKMGHLRGHIYTHTFPTEIHLDHRSTLISTLIHEALHYFYPEASETWILKMERKLINEITDRQVRNIIRRWAQNI